MSRESVVVGDGGQVVFVSETGTRQGILAIVYLNETVAGGSGDGTGISVATGAGVGASLFAGSASGTGVATGSGVGASQFPGVGTGTGVATGSGVGASLFIADGSGVAVATGAGVAPSVVSGAGTGTSVATGLAIGSDASAASGGGIGHGDSKKRKNKKPVLLIKVEEYESPAEVIRQIEEKYSNSVKKSANKPKVKIETPLAEPSRSPEQWVSYYKAMSDNLATQRDYRQMLDLIARASISIQQEAERHEVERQEDELMTLLLVSI